MREAARAEGRRTVERTGKDWYFGRTSRFGDMHAMKGPYSSERSVALMIAQTPRMTGEFLLVRWCKTSRGISPHGTIY